MKAFPISASQPADGPGPAALHRLRIGRSRAPGISTLGADRAAPRQHSLADALPVDKTRSATLTTGSGLISNSLKCDQTDSSARFRLVRCNRHLILPLRLIKHPRTVFAYFARRG